MSKFATGKNAYGISDRSGFRYRLRDMRLEWNGLLVGRDEWEAKQPQLNPIRATPDPQALRNPRPPQNVKQKNNIQWGWNPVGGPATNSINPPNNLQAVCFVGQVVIASPASDVVGGVQATGIVGIATVGPASSAPRFDSTSITLDSTTDTFDEG